jgi:hypothetical protein
MRQGAAIEGLDPAHVANFRARQNTFVIGRDDQGPFRLWGDWCGSDPHADASDATVGALCPDLPREWMRDRLNLYQAVTRAAALPAILRATAGLFADVWCADGPGGSVSPLISIALVCRDGQKLRLEPIAAPTILAASDPTLHLRAIESQGEVTYADGKFALWATENDGSTKSSGAHNPQGSVLPISGGGGISMFSWKSGGLATGQMWLSFGWGAQTAYNPDGTTVAIAAPPAAPPNPVLSQVAGGALAARTRWVRIAYTRSLPGGFVMLYPVSAEASLAILANNLLKVTSPAAVAGYDGWSVLVGSASNAEFKQEVIHGIRNFGTDYVEPTTGFITTPTQYDNANWKSVTLVDLPISVSFSMYPYYDLASGKVELGPFQGSGGDAATAALQLADQHLPLSTLASGTYSFLASISTGGNLLSGSGGGGRLT